MTKTPAKTKAVKKTKAPDGFVKFKRPTGSTITVNDKPETLAAAKSMGWKAV